VLLDERDARTEARAAGGDDEAAGAAPDDDEVCSVPSGSPVEMPRAGAFVPGDRLREVSAADRPEPCRDEDDCFATDQGPALSQADRRDARGTPDARVVPR